jgi:hypothetical protein
VASTENLSRALCHDPIGDDRAQLSIDDRCNRLRLAVVSDADPSITVHGDNPTDAIALLMEERDRFFNGELRVNPHFE